MLFDCDSTLSAIEGIDELAGAHRREIERLTDAAMRGEIALEEIYGERLALIRPTRSQVDALGQRYIDALVPDARETIAALRAEGITVRVISGGVYQAVVRLVHALGLDDTDLAAVRLDFDADGAYAGFDTRSPLARSGGKREQIERWRAELPRPIMFVGDGVTDLEAAPAVDLFVAFAGVVGRPPVTSAAGVVVRSASLAPILPIALAGLSPKHPSARSIFDRGVELLASGRALPTLNPIRR